MSELELLKRYFKSADPHVFEQIVSTYKDMVYGVCYRTLGNAVLAEDATQDTFLRLMRDGAKVHSNLSSWLYTSALCISRNLYKSESARKTREQRWVRDSRENDAGLDKERCTVNDLLSVIDDAIQTLPEKDRALLIDYYILKRTQSDLARDHKISYQMIQKRLKRILNKLRADLQNRKIYAGVAMLTAFLNCSNLVAPERVVENLLKVALAGPLAVQRMSGIRSNWYSSITVKVCCGLAISGLILFVIMSFPQQKEPHQIDKVAQVTTVEPVEKASVVESPDRSMQDDMDPFFSDYREGYKKGQWAHDLYRINKSERVVAFSPAEIMRDASVKGGLTMQVGVLKQNQEISCLQISSKKNADQSFFLPLTALADLQNFRIKFYAGPGGAGVSKISMGLAGLTENGFRPNKQLYELMYMRPIEYVVRWPRNFSEYIISGLVVGVFRSEKIYELRLSTEAGTVTTLHVGIPSGLSIEFNNEFNLLISNFEVWKTKIK